MDELDNIDILDTSVWIAHYYEGTNFTDELRDHINAKKYAEVSYCATSLDRGTAVDSFMSYIGSRNDVYDPNTYSVNTHMDPKQTMILIVDDDHWALLDVIKDDLNSNILHPF